jgi:hypothetical protein
MDILSARHSLDKEIITLKELVDLAKEYDENGENNYPDSAYEGANFVCFVLCNKMGGLTSEEWSNVLFNYENKKKK